MNNKKYIWAGILVLGATTYSLQSNSGVPGHDEPAVVCFHHNMPFGVRESHAACVTDFLFQNPGYGSKSEHSVQDCITSEFFEPNL